MATRTSRSPTNLQRFLRGADYPASKDDLIQIARENDAPDEILDMLEDMPDVDFEGPTDVQEAMGEVQWDEPEQRPAQRRETSRGGDDPNPGRVSSHRRVPDEEIEMFRQQYEERKRLRQQAQEADDAEWDRRLKGHETDALSDARHMRHGYDTRGAVKHPETDKRLKGQETEAIKDAREMRHGYDGRGRVRKFGPGEVDESIADDRERYEARKRGERGEEEVDPETGSHSHRRKDDQGRPLTEYQTAEERHRAQQGGGVRRRQEREPEEQEERPRRRQTWKQFAGNK